MPLLLEAFAVMTLLSDKKRVWGLLAVAAIGLTGCILSVGDRQGARAEGERLERMKQSPQWSDEDDIFTNELERIDGSWIEMTTKFFFGGSDYREPETPPKAERLHAEALSALPASGLRVTWFGHSTMLIELDGVRTLVDPIWSERASPFTWAGPKRFYAPPLALEALPPIDAVVISHDHYDHLDSETVKALGKRDLVWLMPLGVGAHLESWGIPPNRIIELDWWESHQVKGVTLTATPSRHFSGRAVTFMDQNATLWAGWSWTGPTHRLFYSGDTALHPDFSEIGERLGPFDITMMESGAYNALWGDVHLGPEQAVIAHQLVRGRVLMPVHWGLFDLALHGWTEPAERILKAAEALDVEVAMIRPGSSYDIAQPPRVERWWPDLPWVGVEDEPAWSTGVEALQTPLRP